MRLKSVLSSFLALVMIFTLSCPAYATIQTESVSVTAVIQAKSNWCWAACAQMAGRAMYPTSTRTQYSVVYYLKHTSSENYPNVPGSISDSAIGSGYVTYNNVTFNSTASAWNFSQIATSLSNGYPVQAGAGYYSGGIRTGGHVVVIYTTQFIDVTGTFEYYIDYLDPWDGSRNHCTFASFSNGSYNSRIYDQTIYVN